MPSDPLPGAFEPEIAKVEARATIDVACPLLRELVSDGTNVLQRCNLMTRGGDEDVDVAPLVLYRHILEVTDGVEILFREASVRPAIPLIRSSFEAALQLEYILNGNEMLYRQRSLSWVVGYVHERLNVYDRLDPSSARGKEFQSALTVRYPGLAVEVGSMAASAAAAAANLIALLGKAHLQPIEAEYQTRKRPKNWYSLFSGPGNLAELATAVNRRAEYEVLYRRFSRSTHGQDLVTYIARTDEGKGAFRPLRGGAEFRTLAGLAASFILRSKRLLLEKFRSGEDFSRWYQREIQERYNCLFRKAAPQP